MRASVRAWVLGGLVGGCARPCCVRGWMRPCVRGAWVGGCVRACVGGLVVFVCWHLATTMLATTCAMCSARYGLSQLTRAPVCVSLLILWRHVCVCICL